MIQPIVLYSSNHNILKTKTRPSNVHDDRQTLESLIIDMRDTLESIGGLGLAANQIGRNESVCIVRMGDELVTMVNPTITKQSEEQKISIEGCLSLPDVTAKVMRYETVWVQFVNPDADWVEQEIEVGFPNSVVVQHEIDHLNGVLMIDNITPMQRELISTKLKKIARGNTAINYVGMLWRSSQRTWSLVGPFQKLFEFYSYRSNSNSFSSNGEVDGGSIEGETISVQEETNSTEENASGEISEHKDSQDS